MSSDDGPFSPEREQTDESLRLEREKSDYTVGEHLAALEEKADAVISRARERADQVLAAARARADRQPLESSDGARSIVSERALEDRALEQERATADEALRVERAASVAVLSIEREETDKDLSSERALSDDSLATRDDFLGVVSHDLRNMLQVIAGYAKLIGEELELDHHEDRVRLHAQRIQRSGARMNRLIGDLIDVASIEAGSLRVARELADPAQIVTDAVDSLHTHAAARGVSLVFADMPQGLSAEIDPARIFQVLINLLSNAIKFTPARGDIVVRLRAVWDGLPPQVRDAMEQLAVKQRARAKVEFRRHDQRAYEKLVEHGHIPLQPANEPEWWDAGNALRKRMIGRVYTQELVAKAEALAGKYK